MSSATRRRNVSGVAEGGGKPIRTDCANESAGEAGSTISIWSGRGVGSATDERAADRDGAVFLARARNARSGGDASVSLAGGRSGRAVARTYGTSVLDPSDGLASAALTSCGSEGRPAVKGGTAASSGVPGSNSGLEVGGKALMIPEEVTVTDGSSLLPLFQRAPSRSITRMSCASAPQAATRNRTNAAAARRMLR